LSCEDQELANQDCRSATMAFRERLVAKMAQIADELV
jgi:hypothetical protein